MASGKNGYKSKIEIMRSTKFPEVLVVTPLLERDSISKETKKTIKRNHVKYFWISSKGDNNIPMNALAGIEWAKENIKNGPKYYIMIDNDIILGRHMLDRLYEKLKKSSDDIGYAYAGFEFEGSLVHSFPAIPFDPQKLMHANYISSNSMFKMNVIDKVGLVTDDKYKRLLDWAFLLKCLAKGYSGVSVENARFVAISEPGDISAGSQEDYQLKYFRVYEDFIKPLISG